VQQDEGNKSQGYFEETTNSNSGLSDQLHPSLCSSESESHFDRYNPSPVRNVVCQQATAEANHACLGAKGEAGTKSSSAEPQNFREGKT